MRQNYTTTALLNGVCIHFAEAMQCLCSPQNVYFYVVLFQLVIACCNAKKPDSSVRFNFIFSFHLAVPLYFYFVFPCLSSCSAFSSLASVLFFLLERILVPTFNYKLKPIGMGKEEHTLWQNSINQGRLQNEH